MKNSKSLSRDLASIAQVVTAIFMIALTFNLVFMPNTATAQVLKVEPLERFRIALEFWEDLKRDGEGEILFDGQQGDDLIYLCLKDGPMYFAMGRILPSYRAIRVREVFGHFRPMVKKNRNGVTTEIRFVAIPEEGVGKGVYLMSAEYESLLLKKKTVLEKKLDETKESKEVAWIEMELSHIAEAIERVRRPGLHTALKARGLNARPVKK